MQVMSLKQIAEYLNCTEQASRVYIDRYDWHRFRHHDIKKAVFYEVDTEQLEKLRLFVIEKMQKWKTNHLKTRRKKNELQI